jgi:8-oxo-dGTP diphosphatase
VWLGNLQDTGQALIKSFKQVSNTQSVSQRPVTEVAVGILVREDGSYLLGQRPEGKPYAGYWEFPGGKVEKSETIFQALYRELEEELGIKIQDSVPWETIEYDYPHAYVRLNIHHVYRWEGEPRGCEGQKLAWQPKLQSKPTTQGAGVASSVEPLLPATIVILDLMKKNSDK